MAEQDPFLEQSQPTPEPELFGQNQELPVQPQPNPANLRNTAAAATSVAKDATGAAAAAASGNVVGATFKGARAALTALRDPNLRQTLKGSKNRALSFIGSLTGSLQGRLAIAGTISLALLLICLPLFFLGDSGSGVTEGGVDGDGGSGLSRIGNNLVAGNYLDMMTPVYVRKYGSSKGKQFAVSSPQGVFSQECNVQLTSKGMQCLNGNPPGGYLAGNRTSYLSDATGKREPFTDNDGKFYVTGRWPARVANFCGASRNLSAEERKANGNALMGNYDDYFGLKVILYNPETKLAVVGIINEYGPAPWTGIKGFSASNCGGEDNGSQETLWGDGQRQYDPAGFKGRIGGGPDALQDAIKITNEQQVVMGFAKDQSLKPGTVIASPKTISADPGYQEAVSSLSNADDPTEIVKQANASGTSQADCNYIADKMTWDPGLQEDRAGFKSSDGLISRKTPVSVRGRKATITQKIRIDTRMCAFMKLIIDENVAPLRVGAVVSTHFSHGAGSLHWYGQGMDFGNEEASRAIFSWVWAHKSMLQGKGLWPNEMFGPENVMRQIGGLDDFKKRTSFVAGHNNHFHLAFGTFPAQK